MKLTAVRILGAILVLSLVIAAVVGIHYYVADRLVVAPDWWDATPNTLYALVIGGGVALMIGALLAERLLPVPWCRALTWPGYVWMGTVLLLLVGVALSDLVLVVIGTSPTIASARAAVVLCGAGAASAFAVWRALAPPPLREVDIALDRWPTPLDGFRIAQITDLHVGPVLGKRWLSRIVERVNALEADLIVITGDLIDGFVSRMGPETLPYAELSAPHGVYVITGNHEMFNGVSHWCDHYRDTLGLHLLANERVVIGDAPDACFDLAGTHDRTGSVFGHPEDLTAVLSEREAPERPLILLAHDPLSFRKAARLGVDLQLSGHTHGGQIWPLHPIVKAIIPFLAGHYRLGDSQIYVSRGTGFWGPPMRLFAPPEITLVCVRCTT